MSNVTTKLVTPTRLQQLLDCYGSSPSSWPEDERQAALSLLKGSPELITVRDQTQSLDNQLAQIHELEHNTVDQTAVQSLQQRIMNQLPEQELPGRNNSASCNKNITKGEGSTHHPQRSKVWIGSIAASLFIVSLSAGVIHQLFSPAHDPVSQQSSNIANNDFAQWAWEDITGESLAVETDNEPTTLLALVDMEFLAE